MQPEVIMLIGLPGVGKSTWLATFLANNSKSYVLISSDNLIMEWAIRDGFKSYDDAHAAYPDAVIIPELIARTQKAIEQKQNLIIDQVNSTKNLRAAKLSIYPQEYVRKAVWLTGDLDDIRARTKSADRVAQCKSIPDEVWDQLVGEFEPPTTGEFDELEIITV